MATKPKVNDATIDASTEATQAEQSVEPIWQFSQHENPCPVCGEKIRTDENGAIVCAVAKSADECPRLESA